MGQFHRYRWVSFAGINSIQAGVFDEEGNLRDEFSVNDCAVDAAIAGIMVILMDGGGKFLAHIKSLPISDRIKLADAFVQQIQDKKVLLNKALQRANDNGISIPSLNCGVLTMALLHDQLAALVWAADNECILDVVYRRFGLTPDFLFITANDLRQFLTISTALTDDVLEQRAAALNTLFQNIPENQRQAFLEKALMGDLGQAARALPDNDLKLA